MASLLNLRRNGRIIQIDLLNPALLELIPFVMIEKRGDNTFGLAVEAKQEGF